MSLNAGASLIYLVPSEMDVNSAAASSLNHCHKNVCLAFKQTYLWKKTVKAVKNRTRGIRQTKHLFAKFTSVVTVMELQ